MIFFPYLFILTIASTINLNKSNFVSSFDYEPIRNRKHYQLLSKRLLRTHLTGPKRRIIGGHVANDIRKYPYMAYLMRISSEKINSTHLHKSSEACGATLLSQTHALTAAHCFRRNNISEVTDDKYCKKCSIYDLETFTLYVGSTVANYSITKTKLKNIYIHPEHKFVDTTHKCLHRYDIAVMKLAKPLKFNDKIAAIILPKPVTLGRDNLDSTFTSTFLNKKNKECLIIGWGLTSLTDHTPFLQENLKVAQVPLIGIDKCTRDIINSRRKAISGFKKHVCNTDICSKSRNGKIGICHGDSGGPIICGGVQVGVSSWSTSKCVGPHSPSMYTRIDICVKWIQDIMSGKNIEGRYMR